MTEHDPIEELAAALGLRRARPSLGTPEGAWEDAKSGALRIARDWPAWGFGWRAFETGGGPFESDLGAMIAYALDRHASMKNEALRTLLKLALPSVVAAKGAHEWSYMLGPEAKNFQSKLETYNALVQQIEAALVGHEPAPIPMVLFCPQCQVQHIDGFDEASGTNFATHSHRSHQCVCGYVWRPADVPTVGVTALLTKGKADSPVHSDGRLERMAPDALEIRDAAALDFCTKFEGCVVAKHIGEAPRSISMIDVSAWLAGFTEAPGDANIEAIEVWIRDCADRLGGMRVEARTVLTEIAAGVHAGEWRAPVRPRTPADVAPDVAGALLRVENAGLTHAPSTLTLPDDALDGAPSIIDDVNALLAPFKLALVYLTSDSTANTHTYRLQATP